MRANLARMAELSTAAGAQVVLVGMRIPPNYGPQYTEQFSGVYAQIAHDEHLALVPFLLDGVALTPTLMQDDGIHPNGAGQPRLLENVWPALAPLLKPSAHAAP
jgi:acyl-CoA thioesterase-1